MTWVKRQDQLAERHQCARPEHGEWPFRTAAAALGDLWRCNTCGALWQADHACPVCRRAGYAAPHGGQHIVGTVWRPAGWWTRRRNRPPRDRQYRTRRPDWSLMPDPDPPEAGDA